MSTERTLPADALIRRVNADQIPEMLEAYLALQPLFLNMVIARCAETGTVVFARGGVLDRLLLTQIRGSQILDNVKASVSYSHRRPAQSCIDYPATLSISSIPVLDNTFPTAGHIDLKVDGGDETLEAIYRHLRLQIDPRLPQPIPTNQIIPEKLKPYFNPQSQIILSLRHIPEKPGLLGIFFGSEDDIVHLPPTCYWNAAHGMPPPEWPHRMRAEAMGQAIYITGSSNVYDARNPDRCFTIDGLRARIKQVTNSMGTRNELLLPSIPDKVDLPEEAYDYYQQEILQNSNLLAMSMFIEVVARAIRKSLTFDLPFTQKAVAQTNILIKHIQPYWFHPQFPHDPVAVDKNNHELRVAAIINQSKTLDLIHELGLYRVMPHNALRTLRTYQPHHLHHAPELALQVYQTHLYANNN